MTSTRPKGMGCTSKNTSRMGSTVFERASGLNQTTALPSWAQSNHSIKFPEIKEKTDDLPAWAQRSNHKVENKLDLRVSCVRTGSGLRVVQGKDVEIVPIRRSHTTEALDLDKVVVQKENVSRLVLPQIHRKQSASVIAQVKAAGPVVNVFVSENVNEAVLEEDQQSDEVTLLFVKVRV